MVTCQKKRPPNHSEFFYYRSLGVTVVPTENGPAFFRLFFKVLKAFQLWRIDRQTDGRTDALKGYQLSPSSRWREHVALQLSTPRTRRVAAPPPSTFWTACLYCFSTALKILNLQKPPLPPIFFLFYQTLFLSLGGGPPQPPHPPFFFSGCKKLLFLLWVWL